jgi:hypothetical protein
LEDARRCVDVAQGALRSPEEPVGAFCPLDGAGHRPELRPLGDLRRALWGI